MWGRLIYGHIGRHGILGELIVGRQHSGVAEVEEAAICIGGIVWIVLDVSTLRSS